MINAGPLARFLPLGGGLLKPVYDDYAFGNIPATIEYLLTGARRGPLLPPDCFGGVYPAPQKIVLFFIDSFAWTFWNEHARRYRTTWRVARDGVLTPLSALFPTTTAAAVTTLNFGALPSAHAIYEWNLYVPAHGEVIQSLPFSPLGRHPADACLALGRDPRTLLATDSETIHERLARHGVRSIQFAHRSYADSAYNTLIQAGAEVIRHRSLAEALVQLREALARTTGKAWLNLYWGAIDSIGHSYGPRSPHHFAEAAGFWRIFDEVFHDIDSPDTLYLFTADHGQIAGDPGETLHLNEQLPELADHLALSPDGRRILPHGSPRDVFLHVKPESRDAVLALLRRRLDDHALILPMEEALAAGLFGPEPFGEEFRRRIGNILILPYPGRFIWQREPGLLENRHFGAHGGLSGDELITVLGVTDSL